MYQSVLDPNNIYGIPIPQNTNQINTQYLYQDPNQFGNQIQQDSSNRQSGKRNILTQTQVDYGIPQIIPGFQYTQGQQTFNQQRQSQGQNNQLQNRQPGNQSQNRQSGNQSQNRQSGNQTQNRQSGNQTQNRQSGNQSQNRQSGNQPYKKTATYMTVNTLSKLPYSDYTTAEFSHKPFYNICGYAYNSYNGTVRNYNEDKTKTVVNYRKKILVNGQQISPRISYFGLFDGHGGQGCSNFLRDHLDELLFKSKYFPAEPIKAIKEAFINAERIFLERAINSTKNELVDRSGSCALFMLIINNILYAVNLGDSRALYSSESGRTLRQITRDHKPNDNIEKKRIERSGAKVVYANTLNVNGREVILRESDYGEGFTFPYRIMPGGISVSN